VDKTALIVDVVFVVLFVLVTLAVGLIVFEKEYLEIINSNSSKIELWNALRH
jgi:hypothetical protein